MVLKPTCSSKISAYENQWRPSRTGADFAELRHHNAAERVHKDRVRVKLRWRTRTSDQVLRLRNFHVSFTLGSSGSARIP